MAFLPQDSQVLIPATTLAVTAHKIAKIRQEALPATLFCTGITTGSVTVSISPDGGTTFIPVEQAGSPVIFDADTNTFSINSPMTVGVTKTTTTPAVGVFLNTGPRT